MTRARPHAKSSAAARRLIRAALKRHGSQRAAARALGLPNQAQLSKMLAGTIRDTPAMRAALARADARAKRAWAMVKVEQGACVDRELVMASVARLERELAVIKNTIRVDARDAEIL